MGQLTESVRVKVRRPIFSNPIPSVKAFEKHVDSSEYARRLGPQLRPIITSFLGGIGYKAPPKVKNEALWEAMLLKARETGVSLANSHSQTCFEVGFTYAAVCVVPLSYQIHTL
jgi:hypothetical protein